MRALHRHDSQRTGTATGSGATIQIAVAVVLVLGAILRLLLYGDPRLAVANLDTQTYIDSSRPSLLSWDAFSGRRLFTTNLVYKLISSNSNCGQIAVSLPALGKEARREILPCFETIAVLQTALAIASWLWLAFVIARHLKAPLAKLLAAGVLILFAFTPQITEWDSILSSESLSVSLFVLSLGFLIEIAFHLADESTGTDGTLKLLLAVWFIFFALWVFVKDTNLIAIPLALMCLAPLYFSKGFGAKPRFPAIGIFLIALFALGSLAARQSSRWQPSIDDVLHSWIFPYPARVQFMSEHFAMPDPASADYPSWFQSRSSIAYSMFVLLHPGFIAQTVMDNSLVLRLSYMQPYYEPPKTNTASVLLQLGEALHPGSGVFYLVDTIGLIAFWAVALSRGRRDYLAWTWVLTWLYLTAAVSLFLNLLGDSLAVMRHILPSLEMFRLLMWISLLILVDTYLHPAARLLPATNTTATSGEGGGAGA